MSMLVHVAMIFAAAFSISSAGGQRHHVIDSLVGFPEL